jgi:hypothetical protein
MAPLLTATFVLVASLSVAGAQDNGPANPPVPSMSGVVTEVSRTTVTVNVGGNAVNFKCDASTRVMWNASITNDLVYRNPGRPRIATDYVKPGNRVIVRYRQLDDELIAVELRLTKKIR